MKITDIDCTVIYARRNTAFGRVTRTALGPASISEHALVRVQTDAGVTGLGEVCSVFEKKGRDYAEEINQKLAERLIDEDPFELTRHLTLMESLLPDSQPAHAAIDMALHDIVGKALDTPVYTLLGGIVRERIPLSYSIPFGTPDEMAGFAEARVAEGFRTVKVKIGQSHERDVEAVRRLGMDVYLDPLTERCFEVCPGGLTIEDERADSGVRSADIRRNERPRRNRAPIPCPHSSRSRSHRFWLWPQFNKLCFGYYKSLHY